MRKSSYALAVGLLVFGLATQAHAVALDFTGTFTISLAGETVVFPGAGVATINGSNAGGHLSSLGLAGGEYATSGFVLSITPPAGGVIGGIQLTVSNLAGDFSGNGGGGFGGVMPLSGFAKVCLFGPCSAPAANIAVPLGNIGSGGSTAVTAAVNVTVIGAPWTTGTAAIGTVTQMGGVDPVSNTGAASGVLTLVTPIFISTNLGASSVVPSFGILTMHFVPEPATGILLGVGIATLIAGGRRAR
jgi:hypothetical protein